MEFYCIGFSIKLVKNWAWIEELVDFVSVSLEVNLQKSHVRSTCCKLKSYASLKDFMSVSWVKPLLEIIAKHSAWKIFIVTFLPFTHTIYTLITHKLSGGHFRKKTLDGFSTTHTSIFLRESYSSLERNHSSFFFSFPLPLSYLERKFIPEHNPHIFRV